MFCLFSDVYFLLKNHYFSFKFNSVDSSKIVFKNITVLSKKKNLVYNNSFKHLFKFNSFFSEYSNNLNLKKLLKLLNDVFYTKTNFLFIDNNYKMYTPLYNFIFSIKDIMSYKNFFFLNKKYITYTN